MTNNLYFIYATNQNGDDVEAMVSAPSPEIAICHWCDYFKDIYEEGELDGLKDRISVFQFPDNPTAIGGVIDWSGSHDRTMTVVYKDGVRV